MTGSEIQLFSYAIYNEPRILSLVKEEILSDDAKELYRQITLGNISYALERIPRVEISSSEEEIVRSVYLDYVRRQLVNIANYIRSDLKDPQDTLVKIKLLLDNLYDESVREDKNYDILYHLQNLLENNKRDYIPFTIPKIDEKLLGVLRGNIMTIGGDTGSMKTTFALWLSSRWAQRGYKILFFEKEMPVDDVMRRLININCDIDNQQLILGMYNQDMLREKMFSIKTLRIVPATDFDTVFDIYKIVEREKPDIFVIDFITQLDFGGSTASDFNYNMMRSLNALKLLTHKTNSVGVLISQIKKGTIESRSSKIARLDDLEWSSALKQLSAYVMMVFYPSLYYSNVSEDIFYIVFRKLRYSDLFYYPLRVDKKLGKFFDITDKDEFKRAVDLFRNF